MRSERQNCWGALPQGWRYLDGSFSPSVSHIHNDPTFAERIEAQMNPIIFLFTPIFFVMVGLSLNLQDVNWSSPFIWTFSLSLFLVAIVGKLFGALFLNEPWVARIIIGVAMISPRRSGIDLCGIRQGKRNIDERNICGNGNRDCPYHNISSTRDKMAL